MGSFAKTIAILILASSAPTAEARLIDRTSALVNGEVITLSDVNRFRQTFALRKEIDPFIAFFQMNPQTPKDMTDYLVQEQLITQKFPTSKADIDEEIQAVVNKNNIDIETLKGILKAQGTSFDSYQQMMGISIAKRKLMDRELRPLAVVTEDEVKNFYYTNPAFIERKRKQKFLLSYDLGQMRVPSKALANEIAEKIRAGDDFDAVAAKYVDRGVRANALGVLREDSLSQAIRASLEGLKVGEVTKPVEVGESLFVIHKVNAISAPHDPVFEKEKPQIQSHLYQKAMERQLQLWIERERRNAFVHIPE